MHLCSTFSSHTIFFTTDKMKSPQRAVYASICNNISAIIATQNSPALLPLHTDVLGHKLNKSYSLDLGTVRENFALTLRRI